MNQDLSPAQTLDMIRRDTPLSAPNLPELRRDFSAFYLRFAKLEELKISSEIGAPVPALWLEAQDAKPGRVVLFFHGGGFTIGSARDHAGLAGRLARHARARVLSVDYRLAPEDPFPAAPQDCLAVYRWLLQHGQEPASLAVTGISAGGTLALNTLIQARDKGLPLPAAAVCMSPAADLTFSGRSVTTNQDTDWITPTRLEFLRNAYLKGRPADDPQASPLYADLAGLCPILLQGGTGELLWDGIQALAAKLEAREVPVRLESWPGLFHCWQVFASVLPQGREAIAQAGTWLDQRLAG